MNTQSILLLLLVLGLTVLAFRAHYRNVRRGNTCSSCHSCSEANCQMRR